MVELFNAMEKAGETLPDDKDAAAVKKYFEKVYPDMDFERVYASDMKKMVKWFDVLQKNKVEIKLSELPEEEEEEVVAEPVVEEKPAKKATAKKKEAATEEGEPAPKKTARKKKAE
jgi:phosphoenolpyruvate carboxylase